MQLAYSLGAWDDPRAGDALASLALRHADDPFLTAAALSSVNAGNLDAMLTAVLRGGPAAGGSPLVERLLGITAALGDPQAVTRVTAMLTKPDENGGYSREQLSGLATLLDALDRRHVRLPNGGATDALRIVFEHSTRLAAAADADEDDRLAAIAVLAHSPAKASEVLAALAALLVPRESGAVQAAAVAALARRDDPAAAESLLSGWKGYGPALRGAVLDALLSRGEWTRQLLAAVESGAVAPADFDADRRQRLLSLKSDVLRSRAERLLAGAIDADRQKVLDAYRDAATSEGAPARGRQVFGKVCAACHRLSEQGHAVGPDLAGLKDKSPASLLVAILDPNRAVEAKYVNYLALTSQGRTFSGLLESETGNSITLLAAEGKRVELLRTDLDELLRTDLDELTSTAKSTMPEGLEKDLRPQDVADVIAYVRASVPAPERKTFAGNAPAVVTAGEDGALTLDTSTCEIYGPSVVLEEKYRNLGYWSSEDDHAAWELRVPTAGTYDVFVTFACDDSSAGNALLMSCAGSQLTREVPGTGNWDSYRRERFGALMLPAGEQRLVVRSAGELRGALIDLKRIELVPKSD